MWVKIWRKKTEDSEKSQIICIFLIEALNQKLAMYSTGLIQKVLASNFIILTAEDEQVSKDSLF